jgi:hypothetical protein
MATLTAKKLSHAWFSALVLCATISACNRPSAESKDASHSSVATEAKEASFGHRQIDQMLADRPEMVGILRQDDPIFIWIVAGMNGDRIGQRIYWNAREPVSSSAEHAPPYSDYPPYVCISRHAGISGIDKWICLIYELFNIENTKAFTDLHVQALNREINGEEYADGCAKLEYLALKEAKQFFIKNPFPHADRERNLVYAQVVDVPATWEEYMASYFDAQGELHHPGYYFKDYFEETIAPYLEVKQAFE